MILFSKRNKNEHSNITEARRTKYTFKCITKIYMSEVGFEPTPGEPDCDLNAAP